MAQTIDDILKTIQNTKTELPKVYKVINDEVEADALIDATSPSKVAEFRLWEYVMAVMSWLQENLWIAYKADLQAVADAAPTCNARWFADQARLFQYGDVLLFDNTTRKPYYDPVTPANQIITRVAVKDVAGVGVIKVAKGEVSPEALTVPERDSFEAYIRKIQPIGANINIISQASDEIALPMTIIYDAIIPVATVQANVEAAINGYLSAIEFAGTFYTIKLIDEIQKVEGVVDVITDQFQAAQTGGVLENFNRVYEPVSGYLTIHDDHALADVIDYSAEQ